MQQTSLTRSSGPVFSRGFRASWPREAWRLGAMLSLSLNWTLRALRANSLEVLLIITFGQRLVSALPLAQAGCVLLPPPSCLFKLSRWLNKFAFASFLHQEAPRRPRRTLQKVYTAAHKRPEIDITENEHVCDRQIDKFNVWPTERSMTDCSR